MLIFTNHDLSQVIIHALEQPITNKKIT